MIKEPFSIKGEPVFNNDSGFSTDPGEKKVKFKRNQASDMEKMRDSVFNEALPNLNSKDKDFLLWLKEKTNSVTFPNVAVVTFLAGVLGALWAIVCIFFGGTQGMQIITFTTLIYAVIAGPVIEELLKQSGTIYLLEQKPYLLKYKWQVFIIALISSFGFAAIENILYTKVYVSPSMIKNYTTFVNFRWTICVCLHCCCSVIASLGLAESRKKIFKHGKPAELSVAFPYFAIAIALHGIYNTVAIFVLDKIFE